MEFSREFEGRALDQISPIWYQKHYPPSWLAGVRASEYDRSLSIYKITPAPSRDTQLSTFKVAGSSHHGACSKLGCPNGRMNMYCKETSNLWNPMTREVTEPSNCWMKLMVACYPEYNRSLFILCLVSVISIIEIVLINSQQIGIWNAIKVKWRHEIQCYMYIHEFTQISYILQYI